MSGATIILLVVIGGIVAWGFMTDWTFSGLLPREGARCTPDEDSKDENAKEYVYDEDKECLVVNKCKEGWEPNYSNTACISTLPDNPCTGPVENGVYKYDTNSVCVLDTCKDGYIRDGEVCRSCTAADVEGGTSHSHYDVIGQSYTTEDGKCVPKRIAYEGNDAITSCYAYCAGKKDVGPWQGSGSMPSAWTGAKCVGVTNGDDHNTLHDTKKCEDVNNGNDNLCICERSDFFHRQDTFEMPPGLTNTDGDAAMSRGWWVGPTVALYAGTVEDCAEQARALDAPAYGIRLYNHGSSGFENTCYAYTNEWTGASLFEGTADNHYTVCTDSTKKVKDSCA